MVKRIISLLWNALFFLIMSVENMFKPFFERGSSTFTAKCRNQSHILCLFKNNLNTSSATDIIPAQIMLFYSEFE